MTDNFVTNFVTKYIVDLELTLALLSRQLVHLKLKLLIFLFKWKNDISHIELLNKISIYHKLFFKFVLNFISRSGLSEQRLDFLR